MKTFLNKYIEKVYRAELFFLGLYLFGITAQGIASLKYIGLYISIILFVLLWYVDTARLKRNYLEVWQRHKLLLVSTFLLMLAIFISSAFAYGDASQTLRGYRVTFLNVSVFAFIAAGMIHCKKLLHYFFIALVLALIVNIGYFGWEYVQSNPQLDFSIRMTRSFSFNFVYLLPFALIAIFLVSPKMKVVLLSITVIGLLELILSGVRGGWVSVFVSGIIIVAITYITHKTYRKSILIVSTLAVLFMGFSFYYAYQHSDGVRKKIEQGLFYTTGRDKIVKTRLPIFLEYGNYIIGIGGPDNEAYQVFLNDHHAPKVVGHKENNIFRYNSDEPFFLQVFYKEGIVGLLLLLWLLFLVSGKLYKLIITSKENSMEFYFSLAVFASFIPYFFIQGLVELRSFRLLLVYIVLYLTVYEYKNLKEKCELSK